ncbi:MAG: hypothetical protein PHY90_04505, partial [Desulfitobacteriaceae bacterium]|nr:hypothetical protein [Desulfitobacteriaceae bacterium]
GYGWQFPKEGYDCLGVGGANSDKSILEQAGSFFSQLGVEPDSDNTQCCYNHSYWPYFGDGMAKYL